MRSGSLSSSWGVLGVPSMTCDLLATGPLCSVALRPKRPGASDLGQGLGGARCFLQLKERPQGPCREQLDHLDFPCSFLAPGKIQYIGLNQVQR